jgi:plastocyanin
VILEPQAVSELPPQADIPFMDQAQQTFIPSILFVRTGQPTEFRNNDDVLHNVRVRDDATRSGAFNVAIPTGEKYIFTFPRDGFYDVGCDIHPGMSAQIISSSSPYATVADSQGAFAFDNVTPGTYKVVMYSGGEKSERTVNVAPGQAEIDLTR